jgi:hypothetical protein
MTTPTGLDIAYASLQTAIKMLRSTVKAADTEGLDAIDAAAAHAMELAYLRARAPANAKLFPARFSGGPPELPARPIVADLDVFRAIEPLNHLVAALDDFLAEVVFSAECQEWAEATLNATQLLVGAEVVATAARTHLPRLVASIGSRIEHT